MRGIGKPSSVIITAFVFVGGAAALLPTPGFAQFGIPGIPNMPFLGPHPYIGPYRHQSSPPYHSKAPSKHEDDQGEASDKSKEKDATQEEFSASTSTQHREPAPAAHNSSKSVESDAPVKPAAETKIYDDQPAFSPLR